MLNRTRCKDL